MIKKTNVYMGTMPPNWGADFNAKTITFSITDECNLRCTYCYFGHKTNKNVMSFDTAKQAVDNILLDAAHNIYDGVIWEFIGGEPTLEMELIDKISDYILYRMYQLNHKWLYCYRFLIGTNGLLYDSIPFQNYISKHQGNLYVGVTIDGSKEKHDLSRIKKDGSGSYDDVCRILPYWKKQFGGETTKATFSHNDLPYLCDSIINLWNLGIKSVSANIVFEDVWEQKDPEIYKEQLYRLANYIIENDLWDEFSVRFFDPVVGTPNSEHSLRTNYCGSGKMLAVNTRGEYYPCVRFMPSAMNNHKFSMVGNIHSSVNPDRIRAFYILNTLNQSNEECINCDVAGGCSWCTGLNYDDSTIGTIFERQVHLCKMHKANVEVNKYLWRQYELSKHKISPLRYTKLTSISPNNKYLYVLGNSHFSSFCEYHNDANMPLVTMTDEMLDEVIDFCEKNNFVPIFCGFKSLPSNYYAYRMMMLSEYISEGCICHPNYFTQLVTTVNEIDDNINLKDLVALIITYKASQLGELYNKVLKLSKKWKNLNICIVMTELDIDAKTYVSSYSEFLDKASKVILNCWSQENYISINVLTNELVANVNRSCGAGKNTYTVSPDGKFYLCSGFYQNDARNSIGDIKSGIDNIYSKYCDMDNAPLCKNCEVRHCSRCILKNKMGTGEYHIPTELQCVISRIEYEYTHLISNELNKGGIKYRGEYNKNMKRLETFDPLFLSTGGEYPNRGLSLFACNLFEKRKGD